MLNQSFNSPWLREMELRTRTDDLNFSPDDYRLRFGLINPIEIKANKKYNQYLLNNVSLQYELILNEVINEYYDLILEYLYLSKLQEFNTLFLTQLKDLSTNELTVGSNIKSIIDLDQRSTKLEIDLIEIQYQKANVLLLIKDKLPELSGPEWVEDSLISHNRIREILNELLIETEITLTENYLSSSFELDQQDLAIEKAQSFRNIGFIQSEYEANSGGGFNEQLGFQVGITIPLFNPDKPELKRDELRLIERKNRSENRAKDHRLSLEIKTNRLMSLLGQQEALLDKIDQLQKTIDPSIEDPDELFELLLYSKDLEIDYLKSRYDALKVFVDLLADMGQLSKTPRINYLSNELSSY